MFINYDVFIFLLISIIPVISFSIFILKFYKIFNYKNKVNKNIIANIFIITIIVCIIASITGLTIAFRQSKIFLNNLWLDNKTSTKILAQSVLSEIKQIENAAKNFSLSPYIFSYFSDKSKTNYDLVNSTLDRYKDSFNSSVCYILDTEGKVIATSNRNDSDSFLNNNYSFRSYFKEAMQGKISKSIALGVTSNIWGVYVSCPIKSLDNKIKGIVVFKKNLNELQVLFSDFEQILFLIDKTGIIYLSNKNYYNLKNIFKLNIKSVKKNINAFNNFDNLLNESNNKYINLYLINNKPVVYYSQYLGVESWTIVSLSYLNYIYSIKFNIFVLFFLIELVILILSGFIIFLLNKDVIKNLIESEKNFNDLFYNAPLGVFLTYYNDKTPYLANRKASEIFDTIIKTRSSTTSIIDYFSEESILPHFDKEAIDKIIETRGYSSNKENDGEFWITSKSYYFQKTLCRLFFIQDMTQLLKVEKELIESQDRLHEFADLIEEIVFEIDLDGNLVFVNDMGLKSFRYTKEEFLKGVNIRETIAPKDLDRALNNLKRSLTGEKIENSEYLLLRKDGTTFSAYVSGSLLFKDGKAIGIKGVIIDITKHKRFEEEILKIGKIEALGNLAGGIAHDFNNILAIIQNMVSLLKIELENKNYNYNFTKLFSDLDKTLNQAKKLSSQLLTFSKGDAPIKKLIDIKSLIMETSSFVLSGSSIIAEYDIEEGVIDADEGQISQVIQNILINAMQAVNKNGKINISVKQVFIKENPIKTPSQDFVQISIKDNGSGIDQEILPNIFDPFFSTKKDGKGLGLAIAQRIIYKHDGWISVESQKNHGTTFSIFIPSQKNVQLKKEKIENTILKGSGRILFMDDEEMLRNLAKKIINHLGYEVVVARNGTEAIKIFNEYKKRNKPFKCLILDLTIQGDIGGLEVLNEIKKDNPDIKAIVSSGYSEDPVIGNYKNYGFKGVVTKPYTLESLSAIIKKVIEED